MSVFDYLPQAYQEGEQREIVEALTAAVVLKIDEIGRALDSYAVDYLNPETCKEEWLDLLAYWSGWGNIWDASWSVAAKRKLIKRSNEIWENRGNIKALEILFEIFELDVEISASSGFIAGVSVVPATLSASPFELIIKLPALYVLGSPEYALTSRILRFFLPCWVNLEIIFE